MPKHMINTVLDWQATQDLSLWSRVNFRSRTLRLPEPHVDGDQHPVLYLRRCGPELPGGEKPAADRRGYNILDKTVDYDHYRTTLDGRRYTVGMTYNF